MEINWFEIVAQIINFFILLFILQKLLYKPVINAMEERQERIQKSQIEADEKMSEAKELINEYDSKIADIDKEKREILLEARKDAQDKKNHLLKDYREEAQVKRKSYLKEIEDEKEAFMDNLSKNLGESAVKIASHILNTISSREIEEEIFNKFVKDLESLRENIPDIQTVKDKINIKSSRSLTEKEKKDIEEVLRDQLDGYKDIDYDVDNSLVLGHELNLETYTVHTNIKNYLNKIEKDIIENLDVN